MDHVEKGRCVIILGVDAVGQGPGPEMSEDQDLREAGLKVTAPRLKILRVLESSRQRHMSAEDVYRALLDTGEELNLATVYRVLTQFETAGLVSRLHFEGGHSTFELDSGKHHDHILCVVCGRVDEFVDDVIEERQQAIAHRAGYEMTDHSLHIYGICAQCRAAGRITVSRSADEPSDGKADKEQD